MQHVACSLVVKKKVGLNFYFLLRAQLLLASIISSEEEREKDTMDATDSVHFRADATF